MSSIFRASVADERREPAANAEVDPHRRLARA